MTLRLSHFVKVGKSRRWYRRLIKLSVVSICTAGFFYQIWSFLLIYLTYPTVQDESEEHVDSFSLPAITICNRNRYSRLLYCDAYPHLCSWNLTTWETFCATYKKQCPETKPPDFNFGIPEFKHQLERDNLTEFLKVAGQETDLGFILKCSLYGFALNKTCNSSIVIQVMNHGIPYNCFSLFSLLGKQYDESLKVTLTDNYEIHMDLHPEEYINPYEKVRASVVIHDPRKLVNPMLEGVTLSAGKTYMLYPTMEMRTSLPSPYASECIDYLDEWKKNGGHGPLSKHDCIDACKIKAMIEKYGCVLRSMTYPNNYSVCPYHRIYTVSSEVSRRCASICQDACKETIYHLTSEHLVNVQGTCNSTDEHCKNRFLYIYVNFDRMRVQKLQQLPRFESIELLGYIGGYLGMWLGVSLVSLFDFAEVIYEIVYPSLKGKRTQKTTTPAVKFLHQTT